MGFPQFVTANTISVIFCRVAFFLAVPDPGTAKEAWREMLYAEFH